MTLVPPFTVSTPVVVLAVRYIIAVGDVFDGLGYSYSGKGTDRVWNPCSDIWLQSNSQRYGVARFFNRWYSLYDDFCSE